MSTRSRPSTKAVATRERILDAAATEFRQNGYTGTRLADIAERASTQAGSLYYHFASREELVREVLRVGQQSTNDFVMAQLDALGDGGTSLERLRAAAGAHLHAVLSIGDYTAATLRILGQVPEDVASGAIALQRDYGRYWRDLFERAQDDGYLRADLDTRSARMILIGAMNASPDWFHPDQRSGLTVDQLESLILTVFFDGLATTKGRKNLSASATISQDPATTTSPADDTRAAATTARILDAAAMAFRQNGYAGTRLVDVATAAKMQTGSMYYHFDSREDLVTRLLRNAWERTFSYVRRSVDELPPRTTAIDKLGTAMTAHLLSVLGDGDYTSAMLRVLGQVPAEVRAEIQPLQRQYLDIWRDLFRSAGEAGELRSELDLSVVTMLVTGALSGAVEWYSATEHPSPDRLAAQFVHIFFDGATPH